jgi:Cytochrome P460
VIIHRHALFGGSNAGMHFLGVHSDAAYDRHIDKPKPRMPILATACCSLFSILALFAGLPHPRTFSPFYFGVGFLAVVGWGFAEFIDGKPANEAVHKTCFPCHEPAKEKDYVFTRYAP